MIRLIFGDLATRARIWMGVVIVTTTTGGIGAVSAGLIETGNHYGGDIQDDLSGASTLLIVLSTATALIVLRSTADLTVALQQRSYALWQLAGLSPFRVASIVLTQLAIVGTLGAVLGWLLIRACSTPVFGWLLGPLELTSEITVRMSGSGLTAIVIGQAAVVTLGGLRSALKASRTSPIEALRSAEATTVSFGWGKSLLLIALIGAAIALALSLLRGDFQTITDNSVLLVPLIAAVLAVAAPIVFRPVLTFWTRLVPAKFSATWYLARNSAAYRLGQSTASITPLMIAIALVGGLFTTTASLSAAVDEHRALSLGVVAIMIGGPLLVAGIGAMATVFMSGYARERESALIQAAGTTAYVVVLTAVWEALIYTLTAAILAIAAIVLGAIVLARGLGLGFPVISLSSIAVASAGGFVLLLAATLIPTLIALRAEIPTQLSAE